MTIDIILACLGSIVALLISWVLYSLIASLQQERGNIYDLVDKVSALQVKVDRIEAMLSGGHKEQPPE